MNNGLEKRGAIGFSIGFNLDKIGILSYSVV